MNKPKIGLLTSVIDNRKARGTALLAQRLLGELQRYENEFTFVLVHHEPCDDPIYKRYEEVLIPHLPHPFDRQLFREAVFWLRGKHRFDIFHYLHPRVWPSYVLTRAKKIVLTGIEGGHMLKINRAANENWIFRITSRFLNWRMHLIIAASESGRQEIIASYGVPAERVVTVLLGVDDSYAPTPPTTETIDHLHTTYGIEQPYILAVSRFDPHKNILNLLDAFGSFVEKKPDVSLVFIGGSHTSSYSETVAQKIATLREKGAKIVIVPFVDEKDMAATYLLAAALFYPSLHEGFGLPVLEAMACGTPVVASNTSSIPEVAGESALLVDPQDTAGMSAALVRIAEDKALAQTLRMSGIARAREFSWTRATDETVALYRTLLE